MNTTIKDLFFRSEGRYLTDAESGTLLGYGDGLLVRLDSLQAIERAESAILDDVVRAVMEQHPAIVGAHGKEAELRVRRDQALVLRYAAFAMLLGDPNFIYDKLAVWLRTILYALVKPEHVLSGFAALVAACQTHLSPDDAAAVTPYIQIVITEFEQNRGKAS